MKKFGLFTTEDTEVHRVLVNSLQLSVNLCDLRG